MRPFALVNECWLTSDTIECAGSLSKNPSLNNTSREFIELATLLVAKWRANGCHRIGLSGGQGAGKSTLCSAIQKAGEQFGEYIEVLGLDDYYLTKSARMQLGFDVHPLLATRGPPGTHDVSELEKAVRQASEGSPIRVPIFDKGLDDRTGFRDVTKPPNRIVIEGWCIGAREQPNSALRTPINELEGSEDPHGIWRTFVNNCLAESYKKFFASVDELVFVSVPSLDAVRKWRLQQEQERAEQLRLSEKQINRFIQHYERITLWMLADVPDRSDVVVELDEEHRIAGLRIN